MGANRGQALGRISLDPSRSQHRVNRCNPTLDHRKCGNFCRQVPLRAANRCRSIQGAPLFQAGMEKTLDDFRAVSAYAPWLTAHRKPDSLGAFR